MDVENIVENACARATIAFQNEVEAEFERLTSGSGGQYITAIARYNAIEKALPFMLKTALTLALSEMLENMKENL